MNRSLHATLRDAALLLAALLLSSACGSTRGSAVPSGATSGAEAPRVWGWLAEGEFQSLHTHTEAEPPPLHGTEVDIAGTRAYLTLPEGHAPFPAVIVVHEWWGLNANIKHWSDRLAKAGFAALAVDLYGGQVTTDPERAMELMRGVDESRSLDILRAASAFLAEDPRIAAPRRAVIGWCFGGGWSLHAAIAIPELNAAVMYYGHVIEDPEQLRSIHLPLLGVFGNQDRAIPPDAVDRFEAALTQAGVAHRILRYDADHAFANPSSARYDQDNAAAAWAQVRAFLTEQLRASTPTAPHD